MPKVHGSWLMVHGKKKRNGFSLLELLVVAGLFALTATVISVGYNGFSRRQLLTNAVSGLKNDLRFAQSQATSGVKDSGACTSNSILKGWYVEVNLVTTGPSPKNNTYNIKSSCINLYSGTNITSPCDGTIKSANFECVYLYKTVTLPDNVEFSTPASAISYYIFFESLKSEPIFFTNASSASVSQVIDSSTLSTDPRNAKFISTFSFPANTTLSLHELSDPSTTKSVTVSASGGIQ